MAGFSNELADLIQERSPDLDFVSIQMYGDIVTLPDLIETINFEKPFMVTEYGAIGHWEVSTTNWGAPIEQNSSEKAASYLNSYKAAIASNPEQILGSFVFYWGQKQERTPTWYGMFLADGSETEAIDVMHYIWNGEWPHNRAPAIDSMTLDSKTSHDNVKLSAGEQYDVRLIASDPDGDSLEYRWEMMRESEATEEGGDKEEIPEVIAERIDDPGKAYITVTAPDDPGAYRLFVYVYDGQGSAGHANVPFYVQ